MQTDPSTQFEELKKVVEGVAYNTRTSSLLGTCTPRKEPEGQSQAATQQLFRTRGGRYFIVHRQLRVWTPGRGHLLIDDIEPIAKEQAQHWLSEHEPQSNELFLMGLKFKSPPKSVGTSISVRIDSALKEGIVERAKLAGLPANYLHTSYLRHGFEHNIEREPPNPAQYRTGEGVRLLDIGGQPAYDGIVDNGSHLEMFRAEVAADFRSLAHTIPKRLRDRILTAIEGPPVSAVNDAAERSAMRETILADIARWLRLLERPTWSRNTEF